MLGSFVVLYLFLGGCGAGVLMAASIWSLVLYRTGGQSSRQSCACIALIGKLYLTALVILALASLCLLLDLGRPQRFLLLFLRPMPSLLSVGSFVLLATLIGAGCLVAVHLVGDARGIWRVHGVLEALCVLLSATLMVYTGLYMAWMEAVPLWNNPALPVLLAASSASSGLAVVFLVVPFVRDWALLDRWVNVLHRIHIVVLLIEAAALVAFVALAAADPFACRDLAALVRPEGYGAWLAVGFCGFGLLVPLVAEVARCVARTAAPLLASEVLCVAGGLILRFCLVLAGSHWLG